MEHVDSSQYLSGQSLEPLMDILEHMYESVQGFGSVYRHQYRASWNAWHSRTSSNRETLPPSQQPSALARRLSDEVSDNRHGQRWTSADTHGRSAAGHACCDAGSPCRDLASDEGAVGSNPGHPTTNPQVTRHPIICGSRSVSPDVRFWEPEGSGRACWRAGYRPAVG